jgi:hypothetical protein
MRLNIDLSSINLGEMHVDADFNATIEDVIALITVKNNQIDFDRSRLRLNGKLLKN